MLKKILFISPLFILTSAALHIDSNSAPPSTTGAPGEVDCTTSGCHQTFAVNSGSGHTAINFGNSTQKYTPGKTYPVTLEVEQENLIRFGFQVVALKDKDNSNAGSFQVTDGGRNQIVPGFGNLADRRYMTYTFKSTSAAVPGKTSWTFNWTAPSTDEGPVTFYAAALAADNNGNDLGDHCYTTSAKISSGGDQNTTEFMLTTFPNPIKDKISVSYNIPESSYIKIDLADLQGKVIEELFYSQQDKGGYKLSLPFVNRYKGGIYFLRFNCSGKITMKKILITD